MKIIQRIGESVALFGESTLADLPQPYAHSPGDVNKNRVLMRPVTRHRDLAHGLNDSPPRVGCSSFPVCIAIPLMLFDTVSLLT
jgi:hypothetical protein